MPIQQRSGHMILGRSKTAEHGTILISGHQAAVRHYPRLWYADPKFGAATHLFLCLSWPFPQLASDIALLVLRSRAFNSPACLHPQILLVLVYYSQPYGPQNVASADGLAPSNIVLLLVLNFDDSDGGSRWVVAHGAGVSTRQLVAISGNDCLHAHGSNPKKCNGNKLWFLLPLGGKATKMFGWIWAFGCYFYFPLTRRYNRRE